jgi:hypothetical protein
MSCAAAVGSGLDMRLVCIRHYPPAIVDSLNGLAKFEQGFAKR